MERPTSETQMSATKPEEGITFKRKQPMSDNVGDIIFESGMVEYVGVAV
jgi:hypothetical protein